MAEEKESMGFRTPAKDIQDTLVKVQAALSKAKADWASTKDVVDLEADKFYRIISEDLDSGEDVEPSMMVLFVALYLGSAICQLGVELTETHERLADCEKAIRELKLGK